jgi:hypothetical protein
MLSIAGQRHRRTQVGAELALELEQQALGGLLADAGHLDQPPGLLRGDGLRQLAHAHAREHRERGARAHAADLDQLAERLALRRGGKAIEQLGVLAHHEVGQQRDRLAEGGQVVEGAHGHADFIAHAMAIDQHVGRVLEAERAGEFSDHGYPGGGVAAQGCTRPRRAASSAASARDDTLSLR